MNRDEVIETIESFLYEAEIDNVKDFEVDDNYDSITVISKVED